MLHSEKPFSPFPVISCPEEPAEERPDDPDEHRDDDAARVIAGHDGLRDRTGDQAEHDPRDDSHDLASQ